jgi:hypothetical protein
LDDQLYASGVVGGFGDLVGVVFDPCIVEAAGGDKLVDVGGRAEFPAAAEVVDFAEVRGDVASDDCAGGVEGFQDASLGGGGEADSSS